MQIQVDRTPSGTVAIRNSNGRLQLVFRYHGKRTYLSLGLPDTPSNRKYAKAIAAQIEFDILAGHYDPTHEKYVMRAVNKKPKLEPTKPNQYSLAELWDRYVDYKRPQVSQNTLAHDYLQVSRWLKKIPHQSIGEAIRIRDYLLGNSTPDSTRRILTQLSAACNWAIKSGLIDSNPFNGLAADLKVKKPKGEIEYFTEQERATIIAYFWEFNPNYAPLVEFSFRCGCRPSEALALEWGDISDDFTTITFSRSLTSNEYGSKISVKTGLKTQTKRVVPCGATLTNFLRSIAPEDREPQDLLFPSPNGKYTDIANFGKRHWNPALKQLGLKHRTFYKVRHTAITHALDTLDAKDVAALVGNSPDVIYRRYAGIKEGLRTPDF